MGYFDPSGSVLCSIKSRCYTMVYAGNLVAKHDNSGVTLEGPKDLLPQLDSNVSFWFFYFVFYLFL